MKHKILIVDDRQENLFALEEILEELPSEVEVVKALSGNEAVAQTISNHFALILMDVQMPGMNGFEAAEFIRRDKKNSSVPLIFVTAISKEKRYVFKGYEAGAVDYLFKPLDEEILLGKVKIFLELASQRHELQKTLNELSRLHQRHRLMLDCAAEGILSLDSSGDISFANPAAQRILQMKENDLVGTALHDYLICTHDTGEAPHAWEETPIYKSINQGLVFHKDDCQFQTSVKGSFPVEFSCAPLQGDHGLDGAVLMFQDIGKRKQAEEKLLELANNDPLTGLANRNVFPTFQVKAMARAKRTQQNLAVLFLDLDNFKTINDTHGHDAGDILLQSVAKRLLGCARESDLVARLGGDEFAIILENCSESGASDVAQKILISMESPHLLVDSEVIVTTSIGIAMFPNSGDTPEEINKAADAAMYIAKQEGRNNYQFFSPESQSQIMARQQLVIWLRSATKNFSFDINYQPQVDMATGEIVALEALLRWQHDELGAVSPSKFIPLAEEFGMIKTIGEWVLKNACQTHTSWVHAGRNSVNFKLAINVSSHQLKDEKFSQTIKHVLEKNRLSPQQLEIELTETAIMEDPQSSIATLEKIKALGVSASVDDFGTGYSSLSYLQRLPIDTLKIDLVFTRDIGKNQGSEQIIKAIIALAESLNLRLIAEGVETREQLAFLKNHGCNIMQGYYFSHPLSTETITSQLTKHGKILINTP